MTAPPKTRQVHRQRTSPPPQAPRGAKQIVIPMTRPLYDEIWEDPERVRGFLAPWLQAAPELFPAGFDQGYRLQGFGRPSRKLPGVKLRKVVLSDGTSAAEARVVDPEYAPETVNTDGWAATQNAFRAWFPAITVVLCFLHGFLKLRDRCRKARDLHRRVWDVYRAATAEEFRRLMQ